MVPSTEALVAHVLRRTTFGPAPGLVESFAAKGPDGPLEAVDWALNAKPLPILPATVTKDDWDPSLRGWTDNLRSPDAGLHEKMTWFWHGHLTTSSLKVGQIALLHDQQAVLRKHALGNFRDLIQEMTVNAAMLLYLDGAGSSVEAPNENYAREVMELFTLGHGHFAEPDVKAGALGFAGYDVDWDSGKVTFVQERALGGEIEFLGRRGRFRATDLVNMLCGHPACAPFIAGKVYAYLVGSAPQKDRLIALAASFRSNDLDIRSLVADIVHGEEFLQLRMNRPRYPVEWWTAARHVLGAARDGEDSDVQPWVLEQLDQLPHLPPNVAGWPSGVRWLSPSQQLARASYVWSWSARIRELHTEGSDLVEATLIRSGLYEVSPETREALHAAATATAGAADALSVTRRLLTVSLTSPEFALA
jgi:uncharacterized protein (DUF1800 family)